MNTNWRYRLKSDTFCHLLRIHLKGDDPGCSTLDSSTIALFKQILLQNIVSGPQRSYTSDLFIYLEFATFWWECNHFAGKRMYTYLVKEMWWNHLDSTLH